MSMPEAVLHNEVEDDQEEVDGGYPRDIQDGENVMLDPAEMNHKLESSLYSPEDLK